jgi:hypothetical protein
MAGGGKWREPAIPGRRDPDSTPVDRAGRCRDRRVERPDGQRVRRLWSKVEALAGRGRSGGVTR